MRAPSGGSKLALGTAQFGLAYGVSNASGRVTGEQVAAILGRARAAGIDTIDTAPAYGDAESVLATHLPSGKGFRVVTKTARLALGLNVLLDRVRQSADTFGGALDAVLVHAARDLAGLEGDRLWGALLRLRDAGLFHRLGVSAYHQDRPGILAKRFAPDLLQVPVSLLDPRLLRDGTLADMRARHVAVHARSLFHQGLLFLDPAQLPPALAHGAQTLRRIHARIAASGCTPLQAAIGFALRLPVERIVIGVTSAAELDAIARAPDMPPFLDDSCGLDDPVLLDPTRW